MQNLTAATQGESLCEGGAGLKLLKILVENRGSDTEFKKAHLF